MADIGSSTISETASSNNAASPDGMAEGCAPSTVNDTWREGKAAEKRFWNRINGAKTAGGSANAITCNFDVAEAAYYTGARTMVKLATTNTGAASINLNSLGAVTIKDFLGANDVLPGMLTSGQYAEFLYDGTYMRLTNTFRYLGESLIWRQAISSTSTVFDPLPTGFYKHVLTIGDYVSGTDNVGVDVQVKVSSFQTSGYVGTYNDTDSSPTNSPQAQASAGIRLSGDLGNTNSRCLNAELTIINPDGTSVHKKASYWSSWTSNGGVHKHRTGWGAYGSSTAAVTGYKIIPTSGTATGVAILALHRSA